MKKISFNRTITSKDSNSISRYFQDIQDLKPLSHDEEIILTAKIKEGDPRALNKLIEHNTRFVISVAKKYQGRGTQLGDLIGEGNLGLIEAAKRFDPSRGHRFITYAVWWIRQSILASLGEDIKNSHVSIDTPFGEGEDAGYISDTLRSTHAPTDHIVEEESKKTDAHRLLNQLPGRDGEIMKRLFGIEGKRPMAIDEVGKEFGLTQQRVGQIRDAALKNLSAVGKSIVSNI
jgi:RNA polymerase primary sigma factor